ncbi:hypothetical protein [Marimonas arenosa]|uniref:hypothetical protein n=1 Tax=Marimonas arenosa TaxID=1795305 RepID=UPI0027D2DCE8|nr:hypothetical protein [Marimonas arenosa]
MKSDLGPVKRLKVLLGHDWDYLVTDASDHLPIRGELQTGYSDDELMRFVMPG